MSSNAEPGSQIEFQIESSNYTQRIGAIIKKAIGLNTPQRPQPSIALDTCVLIDLYKSPLQYKGEYQLLAQTFQLGITGTVFIESTTFFHRTTGYYLQDNIGTLHQLGIQMLPHPMVANEDYRRVVSNPSLSPYAERDIYADVCIGLEVVRSPAILFVTNNFKHFKVFQACGALPFGFKQLVKIL